MKKIVYLLVFISAFGIAQNKRFIYDYTFIPDSTAVSDVRSEIMFLDTSKDGSKYYSYTVYKSDSTIKVDLEKQLATTGSINITPPTKRPLVTYSVTKTYPDYKIYLHKKLSVDAYKISDERKINWKISSEKEKIGEWNAQKAEADFAGRHWVAWFSTDIPIQDGPYKFRGLPGLIIKIEDVKGAHKMELKGIKNILGPMDTNIWENKEIAVNSKQFQKLIKDYESNPTKSIKQMQMGGATIMMVGKDGATAAFAKEQEERLKNQIKKDNNRIELDLVN